MNPELLKALKALDMPVANPNKNGDEAAKAEDGDGGQREQRGGLVSPAVGLLHSAA